MTQPARIALSGITKRFGDALANHNISVQVLPGEIHALLGENGAGKSTLMKIAYGALQPDADDSFLRKIDFYVLGVEGKVPGGK